MSAISPPRFHQRQRNGVWPDRQRQGRGCYSDSGGAVFGSSLSGVGVWAQSLIGNIFDFKRGLVFRVRNDGQVLSDVGFTTSAADFAELMAVDETSNPATEHFQPGDVLVINRESGKPRKSNQPYSTQVRAFTLPSQDFSVTKELKKQTQPRWCRWLWWESCPQR